MRAVSERLLSEVLFEAPGLLRSREAHLDLVGDLRPGVQFELDGRSWVVTDVAPAASAGLYRRLVVRPSVDESPAAA
jgi:hypothetical protein